MTYFRRFRYYDWFWLNTKVGLLVWGSLYFVSPPSKVTMELGEVLVIVSSMLLILGAMISIIGLALSKATTGFGRRYGYVLEIFGLVLTFVSTFSYLVAIIGLTFQDHTSERISTSAITYTLSAFILSRILLVYAKARGGVIVG